ncbi:hypothetical protein C7476_10933 [Phyllobacterium bourgognense]|uniref:Uncharacterized protein n=1 Tax=Phyllobacterium bourgognense TaxID=314236 RepID=A0A368YNQ0_9HYPH|nr:hypothetical protein C7476_10933 [Phyllobacterium bourgognense]
MTQPAATRSRAGEATAKRQRTIQTKTDQREKSASKPTTKAPQTRARIYPVPPFRKQHLKKPGLEASLDPAPMFDAPFYLGSKNSMARSL